MRTNYTAFGLQQKGIGLAQETNPLHNRYAYNGKELQEDLGLDQYDYGARFYDAQIGRFSTQDNYAAKYYSLAPYQYAANNPIQNIDVNGDSIWVSVMTTDANGNNVTNRYYWQHDQGYEGWHDASGNQVASQNSFMKDVNGALATLNLSKEGSTILNNLTSSSNAFNIENSATDNRFNESNVTKAFANEIKTDPQQSGLLSTLSSSQLNGGSGGTVKWNPSGANVWVLDGKGNTVQQNNPITNLGHELGHAYDANNGLMDDRMEQGLIRNEWQASYRENLIRQQLGQPIRTNYRSYQDANTGVLTPAPPRIINATNVSVKPAWLPK